MGLQGTKSVRLLHEHLLVGCEKGRTSG